jgi:uncharacterized protein
MNENEPPYSLPENNDGEDHAEKGVPYSSVPETLPAVFPHARFGYAAVVCIFLMYQFAGGALHSVSRTGSNATATLLQGIGQVLFMLLPAIWVMRYSPLKAQGLSRTSGSVTPIQWIIGLVGILGVQILGAGFVVLQERLMPPFLMPFYQMLSSWTRIVEEFYRTSFAGTTPLEVVRALVVGAVVPAFSEEFLFRGVLQRSLEEVRSPRRAIIITAVIFGVLHFNPLSAIPLILIGAYLGFLAYYTQSLALPIVAHFLNNAIAIVALYAPRQADLTSETLPIGQAVVLTVVGIGALWGAYTLLRRTPPSHSVVAANTRLSSDS